MGKIMYHRCQDASASGGLRPQIPILGSHSGTSYFRLQQKFIKSSTVLRPCDAAAGVGLHVLRLLRFLVLNELLAGRLWYVSCVGVELTCSADSDRQMASSSPPEIGCVNVIPRCNEWTGKHPVYENLPETYAAINNYLADSPLEGRLYTPPRLALLFTSLQRTGIDCARWRHSLSRVLKGRLLSLG